MYGITIYMCLLNAVTTLWLDDKISLFQFYSPYNLYVLAAVRIIGHNSV